MSQTSESGTVQVRKFTPEGETGSLTVLLAIAAAALLFSFVIAQIELYSFYQYIIAFKVGG